MKIFKFYDFSETKKQLVREYLTQKAEGNPKLFAQDITARDIKIGNSPKPASEEERAAWLGRITSNTPLTDPLEEEARQIAEKVAPNYSQLHTYIIPQLFSASDNNPENIFYFEAQPSIPVKGSQSEKRYDLAQDGSLMFQHSITGLAITAIAEYNIRHGIVIQPGDRISLPTTITVTMKVDDPINSLEVKIENDVPLSNGKGLVETSMTNEAAKVSCEIERLFVEEHLAKEYIEMIDGYIKHVQTADYSEENKQEKLEIACQARLNLTGETVETGTAIGITMCLILPDNKPLSERIKSFQDVILENKTILAKDLKAPGLTLLGRLCTKIKSFITGKEEPKVPSLNVGWFGSHGKALAKKIESDAESMVTQVGKDTTPKLILGPGCGG